MIAEAQIWDTEKVKQLLSKVAAIDKGQWATTGQQHAAECIKIK